MKKFIALISLVSILSCVSCTDKTQGDSTPAPTPSTTEAAAAETTVEGSSEEETTEVATEVSDEEDPDFFNWFGLYMYEPAEFETMTKRGVRGAQLKEDSEQLRSISYLTYASDEVDSMTPESFMEYVYDGINIKDLTEFEFHKSFIREKNIESEETVQVNGVDFIRQAGTYSMSDFDTEKDVAFVAYFGILDFPSVGKQPAAWMAMTSHTDDDSKAEIAKLADTVAERCKPLE